MSTIHFVGGEKGGVGKSFTSRLLAQYHVDNQLPFTGFDTDKSHTTFSRFYSEFTQSISTDDECLDSLFEQLDEHPECDIIVDLAAQTAHNVFQWIDESGFYDLMREIGTKVVFWQVLDDSADCKNLLQSMIDRLENKPCQLVIVKNFGRGENFHLLESTQQYREAMNLGAKVFSLQALPKSVCQKIDFDNLSFWAAANNPHWLSKIERQRVKVWLAKHYQQFREILALPQQAQSQMPPREPIQ